MEQNKEALQNLTLRNMFLPGTHNSAAYLESDVPFHDTFVQRYTFNQVSHFYWVYDRFEFKLDGYLRKLFGHKRLVSETSVATQNQINRLFICWVILRIVLLA